MQQSGAGQHDDAECGSDVNVDDAAVAAFDAA